MTPRSSTTCDKFLIRHNTFDLIVFAFLLMLLLIPRLSYAQNTPLKIQQAASYLSPLDQSLTIQKITVLPGYDNTDGIYARPIEQLIIDLVKSSHRWEFVPVAAKQLTDSPLDLEGSPEKFQAFFSSGFDAKNIAPDAAILPVITRGPNGLTIRLSLFLTSDGKVLAQEVERDFSRFELVDVKATTSKLYEKLIRAIPYDGFILSRQGTRVTLNLGKADGIRPGQSVSAIQIISANRHPKFNILISTNKEILGQVSIVKVDDTLSFGVISSEKERGAIQRLTKIAGVHPIEYSTSQDFTSADKALSERSDNPIAFGSGATEWLPTRSPAFGLVGLTASFGSFTGSTNVSGVGSLDANSDFFPMLGLNAEIWLNPEWSILASLTQGILTTSNPRSGSSPSTLNYSMSKYSISIGYNFLFKDEFFGPKFQLLAGINSYRMFVDDSTPMALTTVNYSGYLLGLGLYFPLQNMDKWAVGGNYLLTAFPRLSESPATSGGNPKNTINEFNVFVERALAINLKARVTLQFDLYSTNFSGAGTRPGGEVATSLSQRFGSLGAGIQYLF